MTDRLADISARIDGIRQLGTVVNAMRGIAAARAQQARAQLAAVDSYTATIAAAIGRAIALMPVADPPAVRRTSRTALVLFCAEQGFAGAFSQRIFDKVGADLAEQGITPDWKGAVPSHSLGIPKLADGIAEALYARIASGEIERLEAVFGQWQPGQGVHVERRCLFPIDMTGFPHAEEANLPLVNLKPAVLLNELTADYLHAQLCKAALHAFAAENEARMEAMAAARSQIERQLAKLQSTQRLVRQENITAEIIELAAGETASRTR
jgi:F-type H+-transporting ATPase subunit gamma